MVDKQHNNIGDLSNKRSKHYELTPDLAECQSND